jgi:hypothetical protein
MSSIGYSIKSLVSRVFSFFLGIRTLTHRSLSFLWNNLNIVYGVLGMSFRILYRYFEEFAIKLYMMRTSFSLHTLSTSFSFHMVRTSFKLGTLKVHHSLKILREKFKSLTRGRYRPL